MNFRLRYAVVLKKLHYKMLKYVEILQLELLQILFLVKCIDQQAGTLQPFAMLQVHAQDAQQLETTRTLFAAFDEVPDG